MSNFLDTTGLRRFYDKISSYFLRKTDTIADLDIDDIFITQKIVTKNANITVYEQDASMVLWTSQYYLAKIPQFEGDLYKYSVLCAPYEPSLNSSDKNLLILGYLIDSKDCYTDNQRIIGSASGNSQTYLVRYEDIEFDEIPNDEDSFINIVTQLASHGLVDIADSGYINYSDAGRMIPFFSYTYYTSDYRGIFDQEYGLGGSLNQSYYVFDDPASNISRLQFSFTPNFDTSLSTQLDPDITNTNITHALKCVAFNDCQIRVTRETSSQSADTHHVVYYIDHTQLFNFSNNKGKMCVLTSKPGPVVFQDAEMWDQIGMNNAKNSMGLMMIIQNTVEPTYYDIYIWDKFFSRETETGERPAFLSLVSAYSGDIFDANSREEVLFHRFFELGPEVVLNMMNETGNGIEELSAIGVLETSITEDRELIYGGSSVSDPGSYSWMEQSSAYSDLVDNTYTPALERLYNTSQLFKIIDFETHITSSDINMNINYSYGTHIQHPNDI